jgi:probable rRNA maturation factor
MILNRQRRVPIQAAGLSRFLARVRRELRLGRREMTICLMNDAEIAGLNGRFRGKRKPTDVLSFPAEALNGNGKNGRYPHAKRAAGNYLGDIAISPAAARRNARRYGRTLEEELRVLMLHGVLHLLGYDHEADNGQMDRAETRLRRRLGLA